MWAFIICSQNKDLREKTRTWILNWFGNQSQVIFLENESSIFKAYNKGISQLNNNIKYVGFCHEDIDVEYVNPKRISKKLDKIDTGFVGVAGSKKLPESGTWWEGYNGIPHPNLSGKAGHQKYEPLPISNVTNIKRWYNEYGSLGQVEVLDGVILFCNRALLNNIKFDDKTFDGFDFYDISITWLINNIGYKNYTIGLKEIEFYHWGLGHVRDTWNENRLKFIEWKGKYLNK